MASHDNPLTARQRSLLNLIAEEPFITLYELEGEVGELNTRVLKPLLDRGLIQEFEQSFKATNLGHLINHTI